MKKFVRRVAIFSFVVLVLLVSAEWYVEHLPNPSRDKHEWMSLHADEVETLLLGNSQVYYGLCPDSMGRHVFSLAQVSQTYRYDAYLLQHYAMPRLKNVILNFSYFSLWEDFEQQEESEFYAARYRIYMDCDLHPRCSKYGFEFCFLPSFREKLTALWKPGNMSWAERGNGTEYTFDNRQEDWDNGEVRARANTYPDYAFLVPQNIDYLQQMVDFCRERDVRFVLLTPPTSASFAACQDAAQTSRNRKELHRFLNSNPEVVYVDLQRDSRFTERDFFDSDHLNTDGAAKMSHIMRSYLQ